MSRFRYCIFLTFLFGLAACSSIDLKRTSIVSIESSIYGKVIDVSEAYLDPNESFAGRVVVGALSGGIVCAIATANTEEDFSKPKAFSYKIERNSGEVLSLISFSIVGKGECVSLIQTDDEDLYILRKIDEKKCSQHSLNTFFLERDVN